MNDAEQSRSASIVLADGDTEDLLVTSMGSDLYRLEESSLFGELRYHDIIEAETRSDGGLQFMRIAYPSQSKTLSWILPEEAFAAPILKKLLDRVMYIGGNWERTLGGVLTLHLPPDKEHSVKNVFQAFVATLPDHTALGK